MIWKLYRKIVYTCKSFWHRQPSVGAQYMRYLDYEQSKRVGWTMYQR